MEEDEIGVISNSSNFEEISQILERFLLSNRNVFDFPKLNNKRVILWTAIFQHLQNQSSRPIHALCLACIRILSRDKSDLENLLCEKWVTVLIERAGLYNFGQMEESMPTIELLDKDIVVEALKCLCNLAFNSEVARALCAHTSMAQGLVARLRIYKEIPFRDEIMLYDMKLLFILTALRQDIRNKIKNELHGMDYLISCVSEILKDASYDAANVPAGASSRMDVSGQYCNLTDDQLAIVCEILKSQFNLAYHSTSSETTSEEEEVLTMKLLPVLTSLLYVRASNVEKLMDLRSNIANLITCVPQSIYSYLTPELCKDEVAEYVYDNRNMDALYALLELLQYRLINSTGTKTQYENLSPILTVMNKSARGCRSHRKFLRQVVLPPLRDVSRPPEEGDTLRNQLCRLLTTPITAVRDLVAEFLFILCKEKVGRMVKYTGFGLAAGHLAQKGLLGGGRVAEYSSSDDSDTDEYLEAQPHIDPVVGCTRPPRIDPFQGMTEEQKEYEAMKLVNMFDRMVTDGVVKPARIGPDGRPQPVEHVLEFRENPPNRPQS